MNRFQKIILTGIIIIFCRVVTGENEPKPSNLSLFFDDIKILSAVTNAIAIQSTVTQNTFDAHAILADTLGVNQANLSDILRHDTTMFNNSLDDVAGAYQTIFDKTNSDYNDVVAASRINEDLKIGMKMDYKLEPSTIQKFFGELEKHETMELMLACNKTIVETVLNFYNVINEKSIASGFLFPGQQQRALELMKSRIQNISTCIDAFKNYRNLVSPIMERGKMLRSVISARDLIKAVTGPKVSSYGTLMDTVARVFSMVRKDFKAPNISLSQKISESVRIHKALQIDKFEFKYILTAGFGSFGGIGDDIKSAWFKEKIAMGKSTVTLKKSLEKFIGFGVLVDKLRKEFWKFYDDYGQKKKFLEQFSENFYKLENFGDIERGEEFLKRYKESFNSCWKSATDTKTDFSEFDQKIDKLISIKNVVFDIMKWTDAIIETMDSEVVTVSLEQIGALNFENKNLDEMKRAISEIENFKYLQNYCSKFVRLKELQDKFQNYYDLLKNVKLDQIIINTIQKLDQTTVTRDLKCLEFQKLNATGLQSMFEFIDSIRFVSNSTELEKLKNIVSGYTNARKKFMKVEDYVEKNMKASSYGPDDKQEMLVKFKSSFKVSQSLAYGVWAVHDIMTAYEQRQDLLNSTKYSKEVNDLIATFNPKFEVRNFWKSKPQSRIKHFLRSLEKFNDYAGKIRGKDLMTIREVFEEARNVTGFKENGYIFKFIYDQLWKYEGTKNEDFEFAIENSNHLQPLWLDFTAYESDLSAAKLSVFEIREYFDEVFGLKNDGNEKIIEYSFTLVICISILLFFIIVSIFLILYGRSENGRRLFKNYQLYYFGKPEEFEKRWRYSLFMDRLENQNALIDAVREINPQNVLQIIKKGAYINVYSQHGNTPLHMASKRGYPEIVEILIKNGADRTLLNSQNKTPEQMITSSNRSNYTTVKTLKQSQKSEKSMAKQDKIEKIFKKYQNKKFRIRVPEVFPSSSFHIYADQATDDHLTNQFMEAFQSIGTTELLPTTTHIIVKTDSEGIVYLDRLELLAWILSGVIIVKESWMVDCLKDKKLIEKDSLYLVEKVRFDGTVYPTVLRWSEAMAKGAMPYLYGVYVAVTIPEYQNFVTLVSIVTTHGGTVLDKFPVKEEYNPGSHPYLHAHLGPLFIIHDGQTNVDIYRNDADKMYTLFTEDEFIVFMLKREIDVDKSVNPIPVLKDGDD